MRLYEIQDMYEEVIIDDSQIDISNDREIHELLDRAAEFIKKDCQPWIQISKGKMIYRGIKNTDVSMILGKFPVKNDRDPRDTPSSIHNILVGIFNELGFSANRNNSLFVSSSYADAQYYGTPYAIFPIGTFTYAWGKGIKDLWTTLTDWGEQKK